MWAWSCGKPRQGGEQYHVGAESDRTDASRGISLLTFNALFFYYSILRSRPRQVACPTARHDERKPPALRRWCRLELSMRLSPPFFFFLYFSVRQGEIFNVIVNVAPGPRE